MEVQKIEHYLSSISDYHALESYVEIKSDGVINGDYIEELAEREDKKREQLIKTIELKPRFKLLNQFMENLISFEMDVVFFYAKILEYDKNKINYDERRIKGLSTHLSLKENRLLKDLFHFEEYSNIIKINIESNEIRLAILIKEHILNNLDLEIRSLKNWFGIDLMNSPLKGALEEFIFKLENSIDIESTKIVLKLQEIQGRGNKIRVRQEKSEKIKTIKDLFNNPDEYLQIKKLLERYDFIEENSNGKFLWKGTKEIPNGEGNQLLLSLFIILNKKKYLKDVSQKKIVEIINTNFQNFEVSSQHYSYSKSGLKNVKNKYSPFYPYKEALSFIPTL